jgi:hypothetical protein
MRAALQWSMITILSISAAITACGAIPVIYAMLNAPEGYEDETGFHLVWSNNTPETPDIACVWICGAV